MNTLSEVAWAGGIDWCSERKIRCFETEARLGPLSDLAKIRYALLLCDTGRAEDSGQMLQSRAAEGLECAPLLLDCCLALRSLLQSGDDREHRLDRFAYGLSMKMNFADEGLGVLDVLASQLLFRGEAGAWRPLDWKLAEAFSGLFDVVDAVVGDVCVAHVCALQSLVMMGKTEQAVRRVRGQGARGDGFESGIAGIAYQLWTLGKRDEAVSLLRCLPEEASHVPLTDYRRALAAAVLGEHELAYRSFVAALGGAGMYPGQGSLSRHLWTAMIFKALGWTASLPHSWNALCERSDYIAPRLHLLEKVSSPPSPYPVPECLSGIASGDPGASRAR